MKEMEMVHCNVLYENNNMNVGMKEKLAPCERIKRKKPLLS